MIFKDQLLKPPDIGIGIDIDTELLKPSDIDGMKSFPTAVLVQQSFAWNLFNFFYFHQDNFLAKNFLEKFQQNLHLAPAC